MKDLIITAMAAAMPYMTWLLWAAAGFAVLAILGLMVRLFDSGSPLVRLGQVASWIIVWGGVIFIVSHGVGVLLGMSPQINFEFLTGEKFDLKPFWQVGAALAVSGIVLRLLGGRRTA
jgi:hypothetical protein